MIKRHPNLFIKLFLIIVFVLLCLFISSCGKEATAEIYIGNTNAPISILILPEPYQYITEREEDHSMKLQQWEEEHYYATKVWEFLRQEGFNQEITCAIIGNMMIETSGGSLDLKPDIYSQDGEYYGLCQWSREYYPDVFELSFEQQLEFLLNNIEWEINTFGNNYKEGFRYEDFINMTDPSEAALAFAKAYERCRPVSYALRQEAAIKAYEYFDLEN